MAWRLFQWGARGLWYETDVLGVYMAHIFVVDGVRVVIQAIGGELTEYLNVMHVQVPGGVPASFGDVTAIAGVFLAWYNGQYRNMFPSSLTGTQIVATGMASAPAPQALATGLLAGTRTGTQLPGDATLCVKLATHLSGRRHRGRFYAWPAVQSDLQTASGYTLAYANALLGVLGNLGAALTTAGYALAVASLTDGQMYPVTAFVAVDRIMDAQRRRLPGRGR